MKKDVSGTVYRKKQWDSLRQRVKEGLAVQGHDILLVREKENEQDHQAH